MNFGKSGFQYFGVVLNGYFLGCKDSTVSLKQRHFNLSALV